MGLDMYMTASKYVGGWNHSTDEDKALYKELIKVSGTDKLATPESPSVTIKTNVAYWRKANAIHSWFVENLAKGVDECQEIYVSVEDMEKLVEECQKALWFYEAGKTLQAGERMKPTSGFFFGSTNVDEYWAEDLKMTIEQLKPLIAAGDDFSFSYQASW